jgi:CHAT domain
MFRRARVLFAAEKNRFWPALIDLYRATLLERQGADGNAYRLCRRAGKVLSTSILPGPAVLCDLLQSRLLLKAGRAAQARDLSNRALGRLQAEGTPSLRFHTYFLQAQIEEQSGDEAAAFGAYQAARREIETLRSHLWGDEPKVSFLKDKLAVYESLVASCLKHRQSPEEAFRYIQQAKSRSLADMMAQAPAAFREPGLDSRIDEIRRSLDTHYRHMERLALSSRPAAAQFENLKQSVRECEGRLARLVTGTAGPEGSAAPLELSAIQIAIPPGALLLEFYIMKGELCVCLLDGSSLTVRRLGNAAKIRERMRLLRFQLRKFRLNDDYRRIAGDSMEQATDTHLRELYQDLLAPLRDRLDSAMHLIFAPHDFLHHLPFHALRAPEGYVIDAFNVSYAPSATVFALCAGRPPAEAVDSLVMGLPDRLAPDIEVEARAVASLLPEARVFLDREATGDVLKRYGPSSRYIHIATHGLFRRDNPVFSAIRLGDSHLTLLDLYRLPLNAELVTLSGCSTGLSLVVGGDELIGLLRGLLLAGTHGVMVSLWDVNDRSTARFMSHFYRRLQTEQNKAAALRGAMLELRNEFPHPYHWAPFVLAGRF